jgi:hypothetical protein
VDSTLYNGGIAKLINDLTAGLKDNYLVSLTPHGISRLDIACDTTENILDQFKDWYNDTHNYSFKNRGKLFVNGTGPSDSQTFIGSLKSREKTIIIYDKTSQMILKEKPFLKDIYNEVFGKSSVYRAELRLYSKETRNLNIDPSMLDDKSYLESIYKEFFNKMVDFRIKGKNSNISSQAKVNLIPFTNLSMVLTKKLNVKVPESNNQVKFLIKKLIEDSGKPEFKEYKTNMTSLALKFVQEYQLEDWFNKKIRSNRLI